MINARREVYDGTTDWVVDLEDPIELPGFFEYYLLIHCEDDGHDIKRTESFTFNVQTTLSLHGKNVPLDGIVSQTMITKCMGDISNWPDLLKDAAETGYNMIHFTPIQERGQSESSYSIYDQVALHSSYFSCLFLLISFLMRTWITRQETKSLELR